MQALTSFDNLLVARKHEHKARNGYQLTKLLEIVNPHLLLADFVVSWQREPLFIIASDQLNIL